MSPMACWRVLAFFVAAIGGAAAPAHAWGFDVHRYIVERAIAQMPAEIRPFYERHRLYLTEHTIDPDLWRNAGFTDEPPRHFLDLDAYGAYPFTALPRDHAAAVAKFGAEMVEKNGLLPWRAEEMSDRLRRSFEALAKGTSRYAFEDLKFFSAVVAHYVADAHVPFHAVVNYDGQLTNQHGIHARFETELFSRYQARLSIDPAPPAPVSGTRDFIFEALLAGFRHVDAVLAADRRAVEGRTVYDDAYFDRFFDDVAPVLDRQLEAAIRGVASVWLGAWEAAGRPPLPLDPPRVTRPVSAPRR